MPTVSAPSGETAAPTVSSRWQAVNSSAFVFAILQSVCTAFMALSGLRVLVGVSSLAFVVGLQKFEATGIHNGAIRYPMLLLALAGAVLNLAILRRLRKLRAKPAAQWRAKPVSRGQLRSERFQMILSLLTLVLVAVELYLHVRFHGL